MPHEQQPQHLEEIGFEDAILQIARVGEDKSTAPKPKASEVPAPKVNSRFLRPEWVLAVTLTAAGVLGLMSASVTNNPEQPTGSQSAAEFSPDFIGYTIGAPDAFQRSIPEDGIVNPQTGHRIPKSELFHTGDLVDRLWAEFAVGINPEEYDKIVQAKQNLTTEQAQVFGYQKAKMLELIQNETTHLALSEKRPSPFIAPNISLYKDVVFVWPKAEKVGDYFRAFEIDYHRAQANTEPVTLQ